MQGRGKDKVVLTLWVHGLCVTFQSQLFSGPFWRVALNSFSFKEAGLLLQQYVYRKMLENTFPHNLCQRVTVGVQSEILP